MCLIRSIPRAQLIPSATLAKYGCLLFVHTYCERYFLALRYPSTSQSGRIERLACHSDHRRATKLSKRPKTFCIIWRAIPCVLFFARSALKLRIQIRGFPSATQSKIPAVMIDGVNFISYRIIIVNPNKIASPNLLQVVNINGG